MSQGSVLVVEDEEDLRDALTSAFEEAGFEVCTARDGGKGIRLAFEKHPDVILLDILLPTMHGNVFLERLRDDDWGKKVKVVVLSNFDWDFNKDWAKKYGAIDYLIKADNSLSHIVEVVQKAIKGDS